MIGSMSVKTLIQKLLITTLVFFTLNCAALASAELAHTELSLSPRFCITTKVNQHCDVTLELRWKMPAPRMICIDSDHPEFSYWCAPSTDISSHIMNISTKQDVHFRLIDKETQHTLTTKTLKVTPTAEPKSRRRNQNPWSLF